MIGTPAVVSARLSLLLSVSVWSTDCTKASEEAWPSASSLAMSKVMSSAAEAPEAKLGIPHSLPAGSWLPVEKVSVGVFAALASN